MLVTSRTALRNSGEQRGLPTEMPRRHQQLLEAPVFTGRTSVGLDVHARSIVGCGLDSVAAWTAFRPAGLQPAYDAAFETVLLTTARRARLDKAIAEMAANSEHTPVVRRLCCLRGVSTLTGFGLAVEIGDWQRFTGARSAPIWGWYPPSPLTGRNALRGRSPRPGTPTPADCWKRRPGTTARPTGRS